MNASEIAKHLGGRKNGSHGWLVRCPAHEDKNPSLSIKDGANGRLLVRCFGSCEPLDVLSALKSIGCLGPVENARPHVYSAATQTHDDNGFRLRLAKKIWADSIPAPGSAVEAYLRSRGIEGDIPPTLRFNSSVQYPGTTDRLPAMVAAVAIEPSREVVAIHRTFLLADGSGKADVPQAKAMLGNCKGGAVRLQSATDTLVVAEGIETALSAMSLYSLPAWAAMTASGIEGLILPDSVRHVMLCADRDKPRPGQPRGHGVESCHKSAERFEREGRSVRIVLPEDGLKDFNDVVRRRMMPQP